MTPEPSTPLHRLSHTDLDALEVTVLGLYAPGLAAENLVQRSFAALQRLVPSDFIAYGAAWANSPEIELRLNEDGSSVQEALAGFARHMSKYRLFNWDVTVNQGLPFHRGDFFSRRQFAQLDIFADAYRPLGLHEHCAVHVPGPEGPTVFYGLERSGTQEFLERDRAVLARLQPHLANARALAHLHGSLPPLTLDELAPQLRLAGFTAREAEVFAWLWQGKTLGEIAIILGIQRTTVKTYVEAIYQRLGVETRVAALHRGWELFSKPAGAKSGGVFLRS